MPGCKMKRREFITLLGGAATAWPLAARAQDGARVRRIAVLSNIAEDDPAMKARFAAFLQGLEKLGWSPGRNIRIDARFGATTPEQIQGRARELLAQQPEVILANAPHVVAAVQRAAGTVPIVFVAVSDPVGAGFIKSLARPGGNLTGLLNYEASITSKWMAMLKEIVPSLTRVALMGNQHTTDYRYFFEATKAAAPSMALEPVPVQVENATDIERAIAMLARTPTTGLVLPPDGTTIQHRSVVIRLAALHRLPAVYAFRFFVDAGGLMCYATDLAEQYRQAASYVNQLLRGANPADLPVQVPTKYETVVNLKAAHTLGLTVPPSLLVRADEVIE